VERTESQLKKLEPYRPWLFRVGLASFFLVNSIGGWTRSDEIMDALMHNRVTLALGHMDGLMNVIGVNDALLCLLILSGKAKKFMLVWATVWMCLVIFVTGFWTSDLIGHLGVLAFLAYYAYTRAD